MSGLLPTLAAWQAQGCLRPLDLALARFVHELDPGAPPSLAVAAALLARLEAAGHSALPLDDVTATVASTLDWPAEALTALSAALAQHPLRPADWAGCAAVQLDPPDAAGGSPLVCTGGRLALRRLWRQEGAIAAALRALAAQATPVDEDRLGALLDRLFPPRPSDDAQRLAAECAARGRLTLLTGGPGTGKTWTAARLLVLLQALHGTPVPLRVALAAPTGKAAARLRQAIEAALQALPPAWADELARWAVALGPARTLHALLGPRPGTRRFRHDAAHPLPHDLVIVDEASMVDLALMHDLLAALAPGARLVLLGDPDQLASVEAGAVLADLCAGPALAGRHVALQESRRFQGTIGALARAVQAGDGGAALARLRAGPPEVLAVQAAADPAALLPLAVQGYRPVLEALQGAGPPEVRAAAALAAFDGFRLLCALREGPWGVEGLNAAVERALAEAGLLPRRGGEWPAGRPVMLLRNQPQDGLFNGDIGLVLPDAGGAPRVWLADGPALRSVAAGRLERVETAWAMTVHKSQGSEFAHVALVLPPQDHPLLTRELVYTGLTRARERFTLVAAQPALLAAAAGRRLERLGGLRARLSGQA